MFSSDPLPSHPSLSIERIEADTEDRSKHQFNIRVVTEPNRLEKGSLDFQIEGISNETRMSVPYFIIP